MASNPRVSYSNLCGPELLGKERKETSSCFRDKRFGMQEVFTLSSGITSSTSKTKFKSNGHKKYSELKLTKQIQLLFLLVMLKIKNIQTLHVYSAYINTLNQMYMQFFFHKTFLKSVSYKA